MRITGTIFGSWLLSTLIGCTSLGKKSSAGCNGDLAGHDRRAAEACNARGLEYAERRKWKEAEDEFRDATRRGTHFCAAYNNLGLALIIQGKSREGLANLAIAARLCPHSPEPEMNIAALHTALRRASPTLHKFAPVDRNGCVDSPYLSSEWRNH